MNKTEQKPKQKTKKVAKKAVVKKPRKKKIAPSKNLLDQIGITAICEKVAECVTLREIALESGSSKTVLLAWLAGYPDQYARAREAQADKLAEDILAIADDSTLDTVMDEDGIERTNHEVVARSKLRVDARKWLAGKMSPKKYGDRIALDAEVKISDLTDEQLAAKLALLQASLIS